MQRLSQIVKDASIMPLYSQCRKKSMQVDGPVCRRLIHFRNRSRMFNSTSRYLVYCTINRDIKRVIITSLSALSQRGPRERHRS